MESPPPLSLCTLVPRIFSRSEQIASSNVLEFSFKFEWPIFFHCTFKMWKKHFPSSQSLPIEDNEYYITIKSLKKCKYGETGTLTEVLSNDGTYRIEVEESRS